MIVKLGKLPKEVPPRLYKLCDGDVIQVLNLTLQYHDKLFYEGFSIGVINPKFVKTGKVYTAEQINEIVKR